MKIGPFAMDLIVRFMDKNDRKRISSFRFLSDENHLYDIPYIDDGDEHHKFDLMKASKEKRKNRLIIDIHGGAYIYGIRKNNAPFASVFWEEGYDVITVDYRLVSKANGVDVKEQIEDLLAFLSFLEKNLKTYGLEKDEIFLVGDSAGGHFALLLAEILLDERLQKDWGVKLALPVKAVLVNCPVYDFVAATEVATMNKKAKVKMFGPHYEDLKWVRLLDPRIHRKELTIPVFVSSCTNDFLKDHSVRANLDFVEDGIKHQFFFLESKKKKIAHVHNVIWPDLPESKKVNESMLRFLEENA